MSKIMAPAPDLEVERWFNTTKPLDLATLKGRVVVVGAFQMLCPGCVSYLIPQLSQVHALFSANDVAVLGLHTVFEHHAAMQPHSLAAFIHEYKIEFPVGVDRPGGPNDPVPRTMRKYALQGTPTLLLIDREGRLRRQALGHIPDMQVGAEIATLIGEKRTFLQAVPPSEPSSPLQSDDCSSGVCAAPGLSRP